VALIQAAKRYAKERSAPAGGKQVFPQAAEVEPFLKRCKEQEDMLVVAGFAIDGITEFYRKYFDAWNRLDFELLADCLADDVVWTISWSSRYEYRGRQEAMDLARAIFGRMGYDLCFHPWDDTDASLPYYKFIDGAVYVTLPYIVTWRPIWTKLIPWPRRPLYISGIDRYVMSRVDGQWKFARLDDDCDLIPVAYQFLPFSSAIMRVSALLLRMHPRVGRFFRSTTRFGRAR